jgi:hypothetical protein
MAAQVALPARQAATLIHAECVTSPSRRTVSPGTVSPPAVDNKGGRAPAATGSDSAQGRSAAWMI